MSIKATTSITTNPNTSPPAHHREHIAVQLPEVVSQILRYLSPYDSPNPSQSNNVFAIARNTKHLYQCLLINHLWYECALRHLWRHVVFEENGSGAESFRQFASTFANKPITNPAPPFFPISFSSPMHLSLSANSSSPSVVDSPLPCKTTKGPTSPSLSTPLSTQSTHEQPPELPVVSLPPSNDLHHRSLRSLTLRQIKGRDTTASLAAIAKHATHLQHLEIYISQSVTNESLTPFFMHHPNRLTHLSLAGCHRVSDASILVLARHVPDLVHLDLRACDMVSDISLTAIATSCPRLHHLNVGRIHEKHRITNQSIVLIAQSTQVAVLGLAGCDISDQAIFALAIHRRHALNRVSVNHCTRLANLGIQCLSSCCPNLSVLELKACPRINDWRTIEALVDRKVSLTLNHHQKHQFQGWSRRYGKNRVTIAPIKQ
ncbi:hypothetical protein BCR42DRAFT_404846 [Absidia repens]|uniref:F-box domain-containing protein n=1 Tax=Absidia repens TaxID=90262 RepID=A0A1X2IWP3_9FUNG|nr:hypothetical protein BCR42DRAFT_404846 [Absidia repens]